MSEKRIVTRRLLSQTALSQIVCYHPHRLEIDDENHKCMIEAKVSDFLIMESPNVHNVEVEIGNWSEYKKSGRKGSQAVDDQSCCSSCCLLPFPFLKKQPKPIVEVDLMKMNLEMDDIERIDNFHVTASSNISFDVVFKDVSVRHTFQNAEWQISADHHSDVTYEYFELFPDEIYQVFLDQMPGESNTISDNNGS